MAESKDDIYLKDFGSKELEGIVTKLRSCSDPKKRYEYLLFLAKKLPVVSVDSFKEEDKVKGCISQVYILGELKDGKLKWKGYSDALITKGMLALLIKGLSNLTPNEVIAIDPSFISATGLNKSLTPSRVNGFMNIFLRMKNQAVSFL